MGELEGISAETLERIDHVFRPSGDGPIPRFFAGRDALRASSRSGARRERPGEAAGGRNEGKESKPTSCGGSAATARTAGSFCHRLPFLLPRPPTKGLREMAIIPSLHAYRGNSRMAYIQRY